MVDSCGNPGTGKLPCRELLGLPTAVCLIGLRTVSLFCELVSEVLFDDSQSLLSRTMHYSESAPWLGWHVAVEDAGRWWGRQRGRRRGGSLWRLQRPREPEPLNSQYFDQYVAKPNHYVAFPQIPARLAV